MAIGTSRYGPSAPSAASGRRYFGGADYGAAVSEGYTNLQIFNWINSNFSKLSPGKNNQPGGGGLYDQIQQRAQQEQRQAAELARRQQEQAARQAEIQRQEEVRQAEIARQEQLQREAAAAQAERLKQMEIGQRTQLANTSRASMQSKFEINSGSKSQKTSGTQGFKRRQLQVNPSAYSALASAAPKKSTLPGVINV